MRLFVAVDLDGATRQAIVRAQHQIAERLDRDRSLRWVSPAHLHLTLAFLGEIVDAAVPPIIEGLSAPMEMDPFEVVFRGIGVFPPRGAPRVLWLGVEEGAGRLVEAQQRVAGRLERLGVEVERRSYRPHLTLARWRPSHGPWRRGDVERVAGFVRAADRGMPVARLEIDHITLYRSRLSPAGPTYAELARATLT